MFVKKFVNKNIGRKLMIDNQMKRQDLMSAAKISSSVATKLQYWQIIMSDQMKHR